MGPVLVVVGHVLGEDLLKMSTPEDQHPVETLATNGADEPFSERIGPWGPDRGVDDVDAFGLEGLVEVPR